MLWNGAPSPKTLMNWHLRTGAHPQSSSVTSDPVPFWARCECGAPGGPSAPEVWGGQLGEAPILLLDFAPRHSTLQAVTARCLGLVKGSCTLGAAGLR